MSSNTKLFVSIALLTICILSLLYQNLTPQGDIDVWRLLMQVIRVAGWMVGIIASLLFIGAIFPRDHYVIRGLAAVGAALHGDTQEPPERHLPDKYFSENRLRHDVKLEDGRVVRLGSHIVFTLAYGLLTKQGDDKSTVGLKITLGEGENSEVYDRLSVTDAMKVAYAYAYGYKLGRFMHIIPQDLLKDGEEDTIVAHIEEIFSSSFNWMLVSKVKVALAENTSIAALEDAADMVLRIACGSVCAAHFNSHSNRDVLDTGWIIYGGDKSVIGRVFYSEETKGLIAITDKSGNGISDDVAKDILDIVAKIEEFHESVRCDSFSVTQM